MLSLFYLHLGKEPASKYLFSSSCFRPKDYAILKQDFVDLLRLLPVNLAVFADADRGVKRPIAFDQSSNG